MSVDHTGRHMRIAVHVSSWGENCDCERRRHKERIIYTYVLHFNCLKKGFCFWWVENIECFYWKEVTKFKFQKMRELREERRRNAKISTVVLLAQARYISQKLLSINSLITVLPPPIYWFEGRGDDTKAQSYKFTNQSKYENETVYTRWYCET